MPDYFEGTLKVTQVANQGKPSKEHIIAILPCTHLNKQPLIFNA